MERNGNGASKGNGKAAALRREIRDLQSMLRDPQATYDPRAKGRITIRLSRAREELTKLVEQP